MLCVLYVLMLIQLSLSSGQFMTYITGTQMFPSMCTFIYCPSILTTEGFIRHITGIWMLSTAYALMSLQCSLAQNTGKRTVINMY